MKFELLPFSYHIIPAQVHVQCSKGCMDMYIQATLGPLMEISSHHN